MPKKFNQEDAEKIFKNGGCICIGKYIGANIPIEYICSCGNTSKITIGNFKKGVRCRKCGNKKSSESRTYSQEENMRKLAKCTEEEFLEYCSNHGIKDIKPIKSKKKLN